MELQHTATPDRLIPSFVIVLLAGSSFNHPRRGRGGGLIILALALAAVVVITLRRVAALL